MADPQSIQESQNLSMFLANHNKITQVSLNCLLASYLMLCKSIKIKLFQFGSNFFPGQFNYLTNILLFFFPPVFAAAVGGDCWLWRAACRYCEFVCGLLWKQNVSNTQWETYAFESRFLLGIKFKKECWGRAWVFEFQIVSGCFWLFFLRGTRLSK